MLRVLPLKRFFKRQPPGEPYLTIIPIVSEGLQFPNSSTFDFQPGYGLYFCFTEGKTRGNDNKTTFPCYVHLNSTKINTSWVELFATVVLLFFNENYVSFRIRYIYIKSNFAPFTPQYFPSLFPK